MEEPVRPSHRDLDSGQRRGLANQPPISFRGDFPSPALMLCQRDSIVHPETVLVVSEWWRRRLAEDFGVAAQVVQNGVDLRHFAPPENATAREADRTRLGLSGRTVILSVGGVEPRKNTLVLLEAFVRARQRIREATGGRRFSSSPAERRCSTTGSTATPSRARRPDWSGSGCWSRIRCCGRGPSITTSFSPTIAPPTCLPSPR